jgi:hypothetical protein
MEILINRTIGRFWWILKRYASMQRPVSQAPMRFQARWLCENSVETIIQTTWDHAKEMHAEASLCDHTKEVYEALHSWDRNVLKGPMKRLCELQLELNQVLSGPLSDEAACACELDETWRSN